MSAMKLFVTRGAGFIDSNFIRHILGLGQQYSVVNYDMLTYAGNENAMNFGEHALAVEEDVPRTAMAGWFRWEKENVNFHDALRKPFRDSTAKQVTIETEWATLAATRD